MEHFIEAQRDRKIGSLMWWWREYVQKRLSRCTNPRFSDIDPEFRK